MAKRWRWARAARAWRLAAALVVLAGGAGQATQPSSGAGVWRDPQTGFAIGGYDPVAYLVERAPRLGRRDHELDLGAAAWRFVNDGNMAAFARDPEVYAPRFGGHDPFRLAEGFLAVGNPVIWAVLDDRLYLFASAETRRRWLDAGPEIRARAAENWPALGTGGR